RRELPTRDGTKALQGVSPIVLGVAHVVDEVRGARSRAVGDEGGSRLHPADRVAQLGGKDEPREEEQVLRPLPRATGGNRSAKRRSPRRQGHDLCSGGQGHGSACYGPITTQEELCRPRSHRTCTTRTPEPRWTG